jgi:hypothetical protein
MKRYDETIVQARRYIDRHGEDLTMLDALKVAHFYTGKIDEAMRYGQSALELARHGSLPRSAAVRRDGGRADRRRDAMSFRSRCGARRRSMPMAP